MPGSADLPDKRRDGDPPDFFISYNGADRTWAEWIAWQLEGAGYRVIIQAWDFRPGSNFVLQMDKATGARRTLAVLSPDYLRARFTHPEWAAAFANDPLGMDSSLIPVRVRKCDVQGLLRQVVYIDLVDLEAAEARRVLLAGVQPGRGKPSTPPPFPGATAVAAPAFPPSLPDRWNVPRPRNADFVGREDVLASVRLGFEGATGGAVRVLSGPPGIGKSEIAAEYAYRRAGDYRVVWWVRAHDPTLIIEDILALGAALGLPQSDPPDRDADLAATHARLAASGGWLLVVDAAETPAVVEAYLPAAGGDVLITSRESGPEHADRTIRIGAWDREASRAYLAHAVLAPTSVLDDLAEELGDFPLALSLAVGQITESGTGAAEYLERVRTARRGRVAVPGAPDRTAGPTELAVRAAELASPAAADLLRLVTFLAPHEMPRAALIVGAAALGESLRSLAGQSAALEDAAAVLRRYSLIETTAEAVRVHPLVQAAIRAGLSARERGRWVGAAVRLMEATFPAEADDPGTWPTGVVLLAHALAAVAHDEAPAAAPAETIRLLTALARFFMSRADFGPARAHARRALDLAVRINGPESSTAAVCHANLGAVLNLAADFGDARAHLERAVDLVARYGEPNDPEMAACLTNLGNVLLRLGETDEATRILERAAGIAKTAYGEDDPATASAIASHARALLRAGADPANARVLLERALDIDRRHFGEEHPRVALRLNDIGTVLSDAGDHAGARRALERALAIDDATLGDAHPSVARDHSNLGNLAQREGDLPTARMHYERALAIERTAFGGVYPWLPGRLERLYEVVVALGDDAAALTLTEEGLAAGEALWGTEHPKLLPILTGHARHLEKAGVPARAIDYLRRAVRIIDGQTAPDPSLVAEAEHSLGRLLLLAGERTQARVHLERARDAIGDVPDAAVFERAGILHGLGTIRLLEHDLPGARALLEEEFALITSSQSPNDSIVEQLAVGLANVAAAQEDLAAANSYSEKLLQAAERARGSADPQVGHYWYQWGELCRRMNDLPSARRCFERGATIARAHFGVEHPNTLTARASLARVLVALGDWEGSQEHLPDLVQWHRTHPDQDTERHYGVLTLQAVALARLGRRAEALTCAAEAVGVSVRAWGDEHPRTTQALGLSDQLRD